MTNGLIEGVTIVTGKAGPARMGGNGGRVGNRPADHNFGGAVAHPRNPPDQASCLSALRLRRFSAIQYCQRAEDGRKPGNLYDVFKSRLSERGGQTTVQIIRNALEAAH